VWHIPRELLATVGLTAPVVKPKDAQPRSTDVPKYRLFCTPSDYELLATKHPRLNELYFVRDAIYPTADYPLLRGLLSIPDLGVITGRAPFGKRFFVFSAPPKLEVHQLPPRAGAPDEFELVGSSFQTCVLFNPNGVWQQFVVCGMVQINNQVQASLPLYKEFRASFDREFSKGKYCNATTYAGPGALALQEQGYPLCANPNLPKVDFQLSSGQK
jgi:hypothetical protein